MSAVDHQWHGRTQKAMTTRSDESLRFIIKDCKEAAQCAQDLGNEAAAGRYLDEMHYAVMELHARKAA